MKSITLRKILFIAFLVAASIGILAYSWYVSTHRDLTPVSEVMFLDGI